MMQQNDALFVPMQFMVHRSWQLFHSKRMQKNVQMENTPISFLDMQDISIQDISISITFPTPKELQK